MGTSGLSALPDAALGAELKEQGHFSGCLFSEKQKSWGDPGPGKGATWSELLQVVPAGP